MPKIPVAKRPVGRPRKNPPMVTVMHNDFEKYITERVMLKEATLSLCALTDTVIKIKICWGNPPDERFANTVLFEVSMTPLSKVSDLISLIHQHTRGQLVVDKLTWILQEDTWKSVDMILTRDDNLTAYGVDKDQIIIMYTPVLDVYTEEIQNHEEPIQEQEPNHGLQEQNYTDFLTVFLQ